MIDNIKNVMLGGTQISKVYLGNEILWQNAIPISSLPIGATVYHMNGNNKYGFIVIAHNHPHYPANSVQIVNDSHVINQDWGHYSPEDFSALYTPLYTADFVNMMMVQNLPVNGYLSPYYEDKAMFAEGKMVLADSNETFNEGKTYGGNPLPYLQNKPQARAGHKTLLRGGVTRYNDPTELFCEYVDTNGTRRNFQYKENRTEFINYGIDIRCISSLSMDTKVKGSPNSGGEYEIII